MKTNTHSPGKMQLLASLSAVSPRLAGAVLLIFCPSKDRSWVAELNNSSRRKYFENELFKNNFSPRNSPPKKRK